MKQIGSMLVIAIVLASEGQVIPQTGTASGIARNMSGCEIDRDRKALSILLETIKSHSLSAAEAMPADKDQFAPVQGEFQGVRTFAQQLKHMAAANNILAAAALGQEAPIDAGDEVGPATVRTKAEILNYLDTSFMHLGTAIDAIGDATLKVRASPISPLPSAVVTRSALITEALTHASDHYGQIVIYLRANGLVPPASRPQLRSNKRP